MSDELKAKMAAGRAARKEKDAGMQVAKEPASYADILSNEEAMEKITAMLEKKIMARMVADAKPTTNSDFGDSIVKAVEKAANGKVDESGLYQEEYVPSGEDRLDPPYVYFAPTRTWTLWHKKEGNLKVAVPFNLKKIVFTEIRAWKDKGVPGGKQKFISTFTCHSKKLASFLESCPEFGGIYYKDLKAAIIRTDNMGMIETYTRNFSGLDISHSELVNMASKYGVATSSEYSRDDYRRIIAEKMTEDQMAGDKERSENLLRAHRAESLLVSQLG